MKMRMMNFTDCVKLAGSSCKCFKGNKVYVSTGALDTDHISENDICFVDYETKPSRANLTVSPGDIIFAKMQGTRKNLLIDNERSEFVYSTGFCAVSPIPGVLEAQYLNHYLASKSFLDQKDRLCSGATQKAITNSNLTRILIPVTSIEEQRNIVNVLDKVCNIIKIRRNQLDLLDDLAKSRFFEMFVETENDKCRWPSKKLSELCTITSSKRIYQQEQCSDGIPFWRVSDLVNRIDLGQVTASLFIPEQKYEELKLAGFVPLPGDILVTSRGTLGKCYIVKKEDKFYFQDGMISWLKNISDCITPLYLLYMFSMPSIKNQINGIQAGSTVSYLSIERLKSLNITVPDKETQEQFILFIEKINQTRLVIQKSLEKTQLLFDSLLQKYFG